MLLRRVRVGFVLLIVSCNSGGGGAGDGMPPQKDGSAEPLNCSDAGTGTSFPCDVAPIIKSKCQRCHNQPAALATCVANNSCLMGPFPLLTWSDTRRPIGTGRVIDALPGAIQTKAMPFVDPMIVPPVEPLTDDELKTMLAWARSCAPPAAAACP